MRIDLNADLGEGFGQWRLTEDDALLTVVTSANVACGFHAGDASTMRRVCAAAVAGGVAIGAQVSYRDLAGFGRREMDYAPGELTDEVLYQLAALDGLARVAGGRVGYLKPHGALYHRCGRDERQAGAVVTAVLAYDPGLAVLGAPGSALLRLAGEAGLRAVPEAFADRAYTAGGTLVPRTEPGAVLTDPDRVIAQALRLVTEGEVDAVTGGEPVPVRAESLCLHGDTPGAVDLARRVRAALAAAGVEVSPFTGA
ncbi:MAG: LamB/YcsF family protein [Mycobacteriales bacterium]